MSSSTWVLSRSFRIEPAHFASVIHELDKLLCNGEPVEEERSACIEDAFYNFAFEIDLAPDGSVHAIRYVRDISPDEPDYEVFDAIAPYVTDGSLVESGDDTGDRQCWYFDGECVRCYDAFIEYPHLPDPNRRILPARII